jgi:UDP-2-acetamido-2,6-beta-L-arabino-hexul-4-ose reductase
LITHLKEAGKNPDIAATSSIQAKLDNPYGISKRGMEECLKDYALTTNARVAVYRLVNVFGKWCRPNYNSVVATFCHNLTHGIPLKVDDPKKIIEFVYVDDIVDSLIAFINGKEPESLEGYATVGPRFKIALGTLADSLTSYASLRTSGRVPDLGDPFIKRLWATFLSYLEPEEFNYSADVKTDARGSLFEAVKTERGGQIFVSHTKPGIIRGNHFHDTKTEKFIVVTGKAKISFRNIRTNDQYHIEVSGDDPKIVDIPPGWTHSIQNIADTELVTLFWASELFNQDKPDTYAAEVMQ